MTTRILHRYRLYGMGLASEWPLLYQAPAPHVPVSVTLVEGPASLFAEGRAHLAARSGATEWSEQTTLGDGSVYLRCADHFEFLVSPDGRRITGRRLASASWVAFHTYLLNQAFSFSLLRLGKEPLHATAVVAGGEAIAFLGDCGGGKSTLAAAFLRAGYALLTDDVLVLDEHGAGILAQPGMPRLKLYPEVARQMLNGQAAGVPMNSLTPKLIIPLPDDRFCSRAVPLRAIYLLGGTRRVARRSVTIRRLSGRRALLALLGSTFNSALVEPDRLARQFRHAVRLLEAVPLKVVSFPRTFDALRPTVEAILEDGRR